MKETNTDKTRNLMDKVSKINEAFENFKGYADLQSVGNVTLQKTEKKSINESKSIAQQLLDTIKEANLNKASLSSIIKGVQKLIDEKK